MKKITATILSVLMSFSLFACSKDAGTDNKDNSGEMVWTVKSASYTYSTGATSVVYTGELKNNSFIMNNLRELRENEVNRNSMILEFESDILEKVRYESQNFGEDIVPGKEFSLSYDDATSTLTKTTIKDGKEHSREVYDITWDNEGRITQYELNTEYFEYDEKYNYKYTYSYGADNFTITLDEIRTESVGGEEDIEVIRRKVSTVPYEEKGDITTVISYFQTDGTTPISIGYGDVKTVEERITSNWWGYVTSHTIHYTDGSSKNYSDAVYTFDDEGKITKMVQERYDSSSIMSPDEEPITVTDTVEFIYDANDNLTKIDCNYDGKVTTLTFEWMQIPAKLDSQIAMLSGSPHWSVSEFIDNYIDFNHEGRLTVRTYTKEAFLSYIQ